MAECAANAAKVLASFFKKKRFLTQAAVNKSPPPSAQTADPAAA
jgi:hypothetical protein